MTPPFMEYWKESGNGEYALLPPAEIRHLTVEGLPKGTYRLTMLVRVYVENKLAYGYASGVYAIANGVKSHDLASGLEEIDEVGWESDGRHTSYGNGYYHAETVELQFEVGADGTLDFGFNTTDYCYTTDVNWVAWKDVHLYYYSTGEEPQPVGTGLKSGDYCLPVYKDGRKPGGLPGRIFPIFRKDFIGMGHLPLEEDALLAELRSHLRP